ncbi:hypothetical protein BS47DRAFT_1338223 [Hydnum rufescens UP504]|uniref:Uncharacterized protein n=1 Tax=Hydnum rufescens UP504 TaxID=1448309 RepID=A0A9P6B6P4_9AGAM|nr:hypothetical protein BS47DRAFT_1338223 [Hydnum rufescens UP504]
MRSTVLLLVSALCAAVHCSPTLTRELPILSYEPVQKDASGRSSFTGPNGRNDPVKFEGIALEARQSTCNTHCNGNYANAADIADAQNGLESHFNQGYTYFRGSVVFKTNNVYAFGCDYGSGQTYSGSQYSVDISCVANACGPSQAGYNGHTVWHSTYGRDVDSFSC